MGEAGLLDHMGSYVAARRMPFEQVLRLSAGGSLETIGTLACCTKGLAVESKMTVIGGQLPSLRESFGRSHARLR
eukprot:1551434-Alexandrium_andersonii.AAC.1